MKILTIITTLAALVVTITGCRRPAVHFPIASMPQVAIQSRTWRAFDTNGNRQADFFLLTDEQERVNRIGYDRDGNQLPDDIVALDEISFASCRHLVLILDGVSYDIVQEFYKSGGLRMFYPPSRVIAPYPTLTDLCLEDILGYIPAQGYEARYFDRARNQIVGGSGSYMLGKNQPYNRLLQYRAYIIWDAIGYVYPWKVFGKEVNNAKTAFDKNQTKEFIAYFVSSAGVGTQMSVQGQKQILQRVEQLAWQVLQETRGLTKITLLSDHGHSYTEGTQLSLEKVLKPRGWRFRNKLTDKKDVVFAPFGVVTFAALWTQSPQALARDIADLQGVDIVSYVDGEKVIVLAWGNQRAEIHCRNGRLKYSATEGDPLGMLPILGKLSSDPQGYYNSDDLLHATVNHKYPDCLERLWRAHMGLAVNPADVLVSLSNNYYTGLESFQRQVKIASTHGSLNNSNSTTFIMSTAGTLPPLMRSRNIPWNMEALTGNRFPMGK